MFQRVTTTSGVGGLTELPNVSIVIASSITSFRFFTTMILAFTCIEKNNNSYKFTRALILSESAFRTARSLGRQSAHTIFRNLLFGNPKWQLNSVTVK